VKKYVYAAVLVASLALGAVSAAKAAPSMAIHNVVAPTGVAPWELESRTPTTWDVDVYGDNAWDYVSCGSTAHYPTADDYATDVDGEDVSPERSAEHWSFKADTSTRFDWNAAVQMYAPLARVTASCDLTRTVYLGKRPYRKLVEFHRSPPSTVSRRPGGCRVFSYSQGRLTIDCRRSRSSGSVTWMFGSRWSDRGGRYGIWWDRSESTFGPHNLSSRWTPGRFYVTETVKPGTMITVTGVWSTTRRLFWKKVYRHDKKTLTAAWPS
jgi:hypothetical protein